jgi:hypothetical protein
MFRPGTAYAFEKQFGELMTGSSLTGAGRSFPTFIPFRGSPFATPEKIISAAVANSKNVLTTKFRRAIVRESFATADNHFAGSPDRRRFRFSTPGRRTPYLAGRASLRRRGAPSPKALARTQRFLQSSRTPSRGLQGGARVGTPGVSADPRTPSPRNRTRRHPREVFDSPYQSGPTGDARPSLTRRT